MLQFLPNMLKRSEMVPIVIGRLKTEEHKILDTGIKISHMVD